MGCMAPLDRVLGALGQMGRNWTADSTVRYGVDHHTAGATFITSSIDFV